MKVAYISHHKRFCYELEWFSKLKIEELKILDVDFNEYPKIESIKANCKITYCPVEFSENKFLNKVFHSTASIYRYKKFEDYLKDVDIVIVLEVFSSLSRQFIKYCKNNNKKSVILVYELIKEHPIYKIPNFYLNKIYNRKNANKIICVSDKAKQHLLFHGFDNSKISVVYPGIDITKFISQNFIRDKNELLFIGKLDLHKGIDIVLNTYIDLIKEKPNLKLNIVGDGVYKDKILKLQKEYNGIIFHGKIINSEVSSILNKGLIYLFPIRDTYKLGMKIGSEQFGFSVIEAMSCGLHIITTDTGAIPEIVGDNGNTIIQQNNKEEFKNYLLKLLNNDLQINNKNIIYSHENYEINKSAERLLGEIST